ncbi:transcriptional regulator, LuxR family [Fulvivirga imtechensis AK7]|uniref:Transcriptional regulator, LuxR family n=1 Tax=Fulvivirga imtechensis AK7 TaxID=1237149 RepID=L8JLA7_9BACT|nr:response regulator transcription factor [Fulvivirga imtechensis]ELR68249.1 transcriptional regulator, LuxR family [Fulvivirga imtechensis AK7]
MKSKILIVDDHKVVRDGVALYLENDPDYEVVNQVSSGMEALKILENERVDLVIIDINMDGLDGIETTRRIMKISKDIRVLALTMHNDYQHIKAMMDAGASGYILKSCDENEMKEAIAAILGDEIYYSKEVAQTVMNNLAKKKPKSGSDGLPTPLTPREKEIYRLILEEDSNQEIAEKLFISVRTVEVHKRNLLEKTGAKNSTGLVLYAIKNNLFEDI